MNILFSATTADWANYGDALQDAIKARGIKAHLSRDIAPDDVDYMIYAPAEQPLDFQSFPRLKAVFSLWAGVESIITNPDLTQTLARMVEPGLAEGMRDYVCGHVLAHHLGLPAQIASQTDRVWEYVAPPLARQRHVGVLGLGALGAACARGLVDLGFQVSGYAQSPKSIPGVDCFHGADGLAQVLASSEILVLLLPLTAQTSGIINADTLAAMPRGAVIINPGRGALIDDEALINALKSGHISGASLDVFTVEPLPKDHPYWTLPNVIVTAHVASATRPDTAAIMIAENLARAINGEPILNLVDRTKGY